VIQVKDLFAGSDWTLTIGPLPVFACEFEIAECVDCHVSDPPFDWRKVVEGLQEAGNTEREHTT
jgi:hypothetical protein